MKNAVIVFLVLFFGACSVKPLQPIVVKYEPEQLNKIDYLNDVKPIFDKRCVVCHSCYNSPCQLKLSSFEGLDRGSSKEKVYFGERLRAQNPSRLFVDAKTTQQWRDREFSSVLESSSPIGTNDSILLHLLEHKMKHPKVEGEYLSESYDVSCVKDTQELADFLDEHPTQGMPFGFPPLSKDEMSVIKQWFAQGAHGPTALQQTQIKKPSKNAQDGIDKFEAFLNNPHAKYVMSARYIYEHLFLAHISFESSPNEFFELVRSYTPASKPIDVIATPRPYDDPQVEKFYYRFQKIHSTIVHKTHMVYDLSDAKLERYKELFIEPKWEETPHIVGYKTAYNAQPFRVFEQIPPKSKYQFMLDESEYVIRTFIRGPVCKGQIALNVIHDHFWVMFMDPKYDLSVKKSSFLKNEYDNLVMPIQEGSDMTLIKTFIDDYNTKAIKYDETRQKRYDEVYKNGLGFESIWRGDNEKSTPLLTVYRHFDSASVYKGALGNIPRTAWIIDYPLFERIYYSLVAGFDVFGNIGHQVSIRRYMDRLRVEGESNFLNLLPQEDREEVFDSWYIDSVEYEKHFLSKNPTKIIYKHVDAKRELLEELIQNHFIKSCDIKFDSINYLAANERAPKLQSTFKTKEDYLQGFRSLVKKGTSFIRLVNDNNANLAYLRIKIPHAQDVVLSVIVNRWHKNVSFLFDEENRLDSSQDDLDFIEGFVGSFPNIFIVVNIEDLEDFFNLITNYDGSDYYRAKFLKYAVTRADNDFWENYDWFQEAFYKQNPHQAGLFDLNRYYYRVLR